jgi:hypothetical protein
MTTFAGWLSEQKDRQDAVGWFSRYWKQLDGKPRLSSPSSIGNHLEDRQAPGGFRDPAIDLPDGTTVTGETVREAYDATLREYRAVRDQIVQPASGGEPAPDEPGPAGAAVQAATQAGVDAVQPPPGERVMSRGELAAGAMRERTAIERIEAKLDAIMITLGLAEPDPLDWAAWYAQADLSASES